VSGPGTCRDASCQPAAVSFGHAGVADSPGQGSIGCSPGQAASPGQAGVCSPDAAHAGSQPTGDPGGNGAGEPGVDAGDAGDPAGLPGWPAGDPGPAAGPPAGEPEPAAAEPGGSATAPLPPADGTHPPVTASWSAETSPVTVSRAAPAGPSRVTAPSSRPTVGNQDTRSTLPSSRACRPSAEVDTADAAASGGPCTATSAASWRVPGATRPKSRAGSAIRTEVRRSAAAAAAATRPSPIDSRRNASRASTARDRSGPAAAAASCAMDAIWSLPGRRTRASHGCRPEPKTHCRTPGSRSRRWSWSSLMPIQPSRSRSAAPLDTPSAIRPAKVGGSGRAVAAMTTRLCHSADRAARKW
jgi:hypothetical protein